MTDQLTEALERFSRSLPVLGSLKGEWGGTTDDERADYAKDAWAIVKAAREHLSCSTITDERWKRRREPGLRRSNTTVCPTNMTTGLSA